MSSAILYLAIVAIWAGVLIPRWLRRDSSTVRADTTPASSPVSADDEPVPSREPVRSPGPQELQEPTGSPGSPATAPGLAGRPSDSRRSPVRDRERKRVLSARRRLLGMLLVLAFGSAGLAVTGMAAWWVVVPPLVMLFGYLALLREASKADAERRELARAQAEAARQDEGARSAEAARQAEAARSAEAAPRATAPRRPTARPPSADIIELTARGASEEREDLYDQYADAKLRAVGDLPGAHPQGLRPAERDVRMEGQLLARHQA